MVVDTTGATYVADSNGTDMRGFAFTVNGNCTLTDVVKQAASDATTAVLMNSSKVTITTANFVSNTATFSQALTSGTTYYLVLNKGGGSRVIYRDLTPGYPIVGSRVTMTIGIYFADGAGGGTTDTGVIYDIVSVTTTGTAPVAAFSGAPLTGNSPKTVVFTDASTNSPTSWSWNFGDGSTSTSQNPSHLYTNAGSYTVTLTATNVDGSDPEVKTAYVVLTSTFIGNANATKGDKELRTDWPVTEGLTAGTNTQKGRQTALLPQKTYVAQRVKTGFS